MAELLLERAAENPVNNLDRAYQLLQIVNDPLRPRPAEAHFLAMLRRDLPQSPPSPEYALLIQQALRLRRQAERAALAIDGATYPYSELVAGWIARPIAEADRQRRLGEDLLFAADGASWDKAREYLTTAAGFYQEAQTTAQAIRSSLAVRDQLLSGLPYYSWWLAGRRQSPDREKSDEQLLKSIEELWEQTHRLAALLEPGRGGPDKPEMVDVKSLRELATGLDKKYQALQTQWTESWRESSVIDSPATWRDAHDALEVPVPDAALRLRLLGNARRISRELQLRTAQNEAKAAPVEAKTNRELSQKEGQRHGRMAMAVLGKQWFDQLRGGNRETFQEVTHRLDEFTVEAQWWLSLNKAGEQIGARFQQIPAEIDQQITVSRKTPERAKCLAA
jgi:hypothetical protein